MAVKLEKMKMLMPADLAEQVLKSEYLPIYEKYSSVVEHVLVATTLTSTLKDLRRKGFKTENLKDKHFEQLFEAVKDKLISKEAIHVILEKWCENPELSMEQMGITSMSEVQLREIVTDVFEKYPQLVKDKRMGALMGEVMKEARGRIDGATIARVLKEMLVELIEDHSKYSAGDYVLTFTAKTWLCRERWICNEAYET